MAHFETRAAFRAPDPIKAAEGFIADYDAVVAQLASEGAEPTVARSLAGIASVGADPLATARKLLQNFDAVLRLAKKTHPGATKLSACDDRARLNAAATSGLNIATRAHVPAARHDTCGGEARALNYQTVVIEKALDWNPDGVILASGATATRCRPP